jgi:hypothetical protein
MNTKRQVIACAVLVGLATTSGAAIADDHAYTEGPVVNLAAIRTEYGKFDDYVKYLDTTLKGEQEAAKKAGHIRWRNRQGRCDCKTSGRKFVDVEPGRGRSRQDPTSAGIVDRTGA